MGDNERNVKAEIEAVLFMSPEQLTIEQLAAAINIGSIGIVKQNLKALKEQYDNNGSAIEVWEEDGKCGMRVRDAFLNAVAAVVQQAELGKSELKALAYIAKKEGNVGVLQSDLIRALGSGAYAHVHELIEQGFVNARKRGRTKLLNTTKKFKDYFKVENI